MPSDKPEAQARVNIDTQLEDAGWTDLGTGPITTGTGYAQEYPTQNGPADYVLLYKGTPLAIVEAKPPGQEISGALPQARRYAEDIQTGFGVPETKYTVPFVFSANGEDICVQDLRQDAPIGTSLTTFHTPVGLHDRYTNYDYTWSLNQLNDWPVNKTDPGLWDHQEEAIEAIEEGLQDQQRRMLVHMATGTGKTRMSIAAVYRLMRKGYANRVLFVPDTRHLVRQAAQDFETYETPKGQFTDVYDVVNSIDDPDSAIKGGEVVVSTLQKMYTLMEDRNERFFDPSDFDLIITDECHRLIYENDGYGTVLQTFDAVEIGLTATPSKRTLGAYGGEAVYTYDYADGVHDNRVVPYNIHEIQTEITMNGVEKDGKRYPSSALGRSVFVPDSHRTIAKRLKDEIDDDKLILVFAKNQRHAEHIVQDFQSVYSDKPPDYINRITSDADRPHQALKDFQRRRDNPKIAVTVDMVTTGVDVKPLENLVLLCPVKSPVKYNQMMGRGTRRYDGKTEFTVFDCVGALDHFSGHPPFNTKTFESPDSSDGEGRPQPPKPPVTPTVIDDADEILLDERQLGTKDQRTISLAEFKRRFEDFITSHEMKDWIAPFTSSRKVSEEELAVVQEKLRGQKEYYTEDRLRRAYGVSDADLPDFILTALTGRDAVLTSDVRVEKALRVIQAEMGLDADEMQWLHLMKKTLEANGEITQHHFAFGSLLQHGGYRTARDCFGSDEQLQKAIDRLEEVFTSAETFEE